jgi:hypothetical protein
MYEATQHFTWLDWVVLSAYSMIARARPMLDGELGWQWRAADGTPNHLTGDNILSEFQIARPLLRAARLAAAADDYAHRREADAVGRFAIDHILAKWMDRRPGSAGGQRPEALGRLAWVQAAEKKRGWESMLDKSEHPEHPWLDTWSMSGLLYLEVHAQTGNGRARERASTLAAAFKRRRNLGPDGAWTWDLGVDVDVWSEQGGNTAGCPDTTHANREAAWVVEGYTAHTGFDRSDVEAVANTFLYRILVRSGRPRFRNYIDGSDTPYRGYAFEGSTASAASIYDGWARLAWVDERVRQVIEAVEADNASGDRGHANATVWAELELPGHLALAEAPRDGW